MNRTDGSRGAGTGGLSEVGGGQLVRDRPECARVLVVEEHGLLAIGLQLALSGRCWDVQTTSGPTALDVVAHARCFQPQCVLLDIHLGADMGSGIDLIGPLLSTGAQVVMLTAEKRRLVLAECVEAGAAGWIGKGAMLDEVDSMLTRVLAGEQLIGRSDRAALFDELQLARVDESNAQATFERLTKREALVLGALIEGLSAEEIAAAHYVALTTVRSQIRSLLQKLGVKSQLAAVAIASAHRELLPQQTPAGHDRRRAHHPRVRRVGPAFRV